MYFIIRTSEEGGRSEERKLRAFKASVVSLKSQNVFLLDYCREVKGDFVAAFYDTEGIEIA